MPESLRPVLARVVGGLVAALAVWLTRKFEVVLDPDQQAQLTDAAVALAYGIGTIVYGLVHKAVNSKINPTDAATKELARKSKVDQRHLKATSGK